MLRCLEENQTHDVTSTTLPKHQGKSKQQAQWFETPVLRQPFGPYEILAEPRHSQAGIPDVYGSRLPGATEAWPQTSGRFSAWDLAVQPGVGVFVNRQSIRAGKKN